jgi:pSer/pThr/pTyr-binding forkhead associated (FHA) protein
MEGVMKMRKNPLLFLSYSREDTEKAKALKERLEKLNYDVWMDSEYIRAGRLWRSQIIDGIEKCIVHVILLTQHSICSDNVRRELDLARAKKKPILPIADQLDASQLPKEMEYQLIGLQQIDYDEFMACDHPQNIIMELTRAPETRTMHVIDFASVPRLEHEEDGRRIYLQQKEIRIGRGPDVDLDLTPWDRYHYVSRRHAVIFWDDGKWMVRGAEEARNPTTVNSVRVGCGSGQPLTNGATVAFADIQFRYHHQEQQ